MIKQFFPLLLLLFVATATATAQKAFPTPDLVTVDQQPAALKDYIGNGKATVVAVWATWCQPCHTELDHMKAYLDKWEKDYNANVLAISVDQRHMVRRIPPLVQRKGWKYNILVDSDGQLQSTLGFRSIPTMYVIDGDGKIVKTFTGYKSGREAAVDKLLKGLAAKK